MTLNIIVGSIGEKEARERHAFEVYLRDRKEVGLFFVQSLADGHASIEGIVAQVFARQRVGLYVGLVTSRMNKASREECRYSYQKAKEKDIPRVIFVKDGAEEREEIEELLRDFDWRDLRRYGTINDLGPAFEQYAFGRLYKAERFAEDQALGI